MARRNGVMTGPGGFRLDLDELDMNRSAFRYCDLAGGRLEAAGFQWAVVTWPWWESVVPFATADIKARPGLSREAQRAVMDVAVERLDAITEELLRSDEWHVRRKLWRIRRLRLWARVSSGGLRARLRCIARSCRLAA